MTDDRAAMRNDRLVVQDKGSRMVRVAMYLCRQLMVKGDEDVIGRLKWNSKAETLAATGYTHSLHQIPFRSTHALSKSGGPPFSRSNLQATRPADGCTSGGRVLPNADRCQHVILAVRLHSDVGSAPPFWRKRWTLVVAETHQVK